MSKMLKDATRRCTISFIDHYKNMGKQFRTLNRDEMTAIASGFSDLARQCGIALFTCAEEIDLSQYDIAHAACIDQNMIEQIVGCPIRAKTDTNQRAACRCIESVDIGVYDTCANGCAYCYATSSQKTVLRRIRAHDPKAPMLTGYPTGNEMITDCTTPSQKEHQMRLF